MHQCRRFVLTAAAFLLISFQLLQVDSTITGTCTSIFVPNADYQREALWDEGRQMFLETCRQLESQVKLVRPLPCPFRVLNRSMTAEQVYDSSII